MLAALLAIALFASAPADSTPFERFAFHYETGWGNRIDTIEGTIARDNCLEPAHDARVKLSKKQLRVIYDRMLELRAFELPDGNPGRDRDPLACGGFSPSTYTRIDLRAGATIRHFWFSRSEPMPCGPDYPDDWGRLLAVEAFLDSTLKALPEYQKLPHKYCGRY